MPSSGKEPLLLEQLAEFHMAVVHNAGGQISYDECVAIVKREHPKWKKYREQLALDTTDMSLFELFDRLIRIAHPTCFNISRSLNRSLQQIQYIDFLSDL